MSNGDDEAADDPEDVSGAEEEATDEAGSADEEPDGAENGGEESEQAETGDEETEQAETDDEETDETDAADEEPEESSEDDDVADVQAEIDALVADFEARLDEVEDALDAAETEIDLDEVEADLDAVEADLEETEFPEPEPEETDEEEEDEEEDDDDDDEEDPTEELQDRIDDLRSDLEDQRGPYAEDVQTGVSGAAATIRNTRWAAEGEPEVRTVVETFLTSAGEDLDTSFEVDDEDLEAYADALDEVGEVVTEEGEPYPDGLHPDEDAGTIAALLEAIDDLEDGLEEATAWDDLEVAEQLRREGFYDRLVPENSKDFPPERNVIRIAESEGDVDRLLLAFEHLDSDFIEENCVDAFRRLGPVAAEAFDAMHQQAQRRQVGPIEVLGKLGDDRAVDTLVDYVDGNNVPVQKASLRALGEIGSEEASQAIANVLVDDDPDVRARAARALGLIGDTRAVDPLADVLDDGEEDDNVRAAAAWALVQIGTERALEAAAAHGDDRAYTVQAEAEKAREATSA